MGTPSLKLLTTHRRWLFRRPDLDELGIVVNGGTMLISQAVGEPFSLGNKVLGLNIMFCSSSEG